MEADWEIEIGEEAPIIDACWPGFVDLRAEPGQVSELPEVREFHSLGDALIRLNSADSLVWTAKCDVWQIADFDRFELDAPEEDAICALACYIDLLPTGEWRLAERAIGWCESLCARLRSVPLRCCRADLVLRRAVVAPGRLDLGVTAYLTACGSAETAATAQLGFALNAFADAVKVDPIPLAARSKLQWNHTGE